MTLRELLLSLAIILLVDGLAVGFAFVSPNLLTITAAVGFSFAGIGATFDLIATYQGRTPPHLSIKAERPEEPAWYAE